MAAPSHRECHASPRRRSGALWTCPHRTTSPRRCRPSPRRRPRQPLHVRSPPPPPPRRRRRLRLSTWRICSVTRAQSTPCASPRTVCPPAALLARQTFAADRCALWHGQEEIVPARRATCIGGRWYVAHRALWARDLSSHVSPRLRGQRARCAGAAGAQMGVLCSGSSQAPSLAARLLATRTTSTGRPGPP